ncbi:MAG TPA: zinc-binding dehydrogenase [Mycobacteriales bacterium]|nr:zinc-binding dehydrogenase [Mycobacteriales bacterium]
MVAAAVLDAQGGHHEVRDVTLRELGSHDVRVQLAAAGVCHSDLSLASGALAQPVPAILGHEGSGTVVAVGDAVTTASVGDHVVLNWAPACRGCWFCLAGEPWLCERPPSASTGPHAICDGTEIAAALGTGAFATETVVEQRAVVPIGDDVPLETAALLGCAVLTGVGAVRRTARAQPGESVLVLGLGGIGLSAVQGARLAGAAQVIAVDIAADKEPLARACGATEFRLGGDDLAKQVRELTDGRGVDVAVECIGRGATIRQAWSATRRGGRAVVVGVGRREDRVEFGALELFHFARSLSGCVYGSSDPDGDVPELVDHWRAGRLDLDALVTHRIGLDGIDEAFARMQRGEGGRTLVVL